MNAADQKVLIAFRRLLLSKQLYLHGLEHSNKTGGLNKMIAIHNFHNAIEIALRAILLHYEIRSDKQLNIEFEVMLNEIDNHKVFREKGIKLPYRQELRTLNQLRNLVQHHATEPESATMDDWRVFTRRFLEQVCQAYFDLKFDSLSPLDMIEDKYLKELLRLSFSSIEEHNLKRSLRLATAVFEWAGAGISSFISAERLLNSSFDHPYLPREFSELKEAFGKLAQRSRRAEYHIALLSSGVSLWDYKTFESSTPSIDFDSIGYPIGDLFFVEQRKPEPDEETARWVYDFVVTTIVRWQVLGLAPTVPEWGREGTEKLIKECGGVV